MKRRMNQFVAVALVACLAITFSCDKNEKEGDAPLLPPISTLVPDLEDIYNAYQPEKSAQVGPTYNNISMAILAITYWNAHLVVGLALPVASFTAAVNQEPVRVDNDTWLWSYDFEYPEGTEFTAELTADVVEDLVYWEMRIIQGEVLDFVWYTGTSNVIATEGTWTLYDNPEDNNEFISIVWEVDYEAETFTVNYENIRAGDQYEGSYIECGTADAVNYYYEVYDSYDDVTYTILFDSATNEGSISDGGEPGCWNEYFQDVSCGDPV